VTKERLWLVAIAVFVAALLVLTGTIGRIAALVILVVLVDRIAREQARRREAERHLHDLNTELETRVKERTAALEESETRLRTTLDGMIEGCQIIGFDTRYIYVNPAAAAHGRRPMDELLGRTMAECYPGIEHTAMFQALQRCLTDRLPHQMENEFAYPDGTRAWFELRIQPVREGAFVLSFDITERKQAEAELRRSESRYRGLLAGLPEMVFVQDRDGVFLDCHVPDPSLLLVPVERFLGRPMTEVLPAAVAESARIAIDRAFASMGPATFEYDMALPSGNRWFEAIVVPTDQDRVTTVIRDVTDRRVLEAQLRQAQKMEAVGRLSGGIAHDFNNLLTVISTNAELIAGEMPSDLGFADDLAELRAATRRGAEMVAQLLRFSRRDLLNRQPVNPAAVVRDFVAMLRRLLPETVRLELEEDAKPGTVLADSGALEQIVANLCTNARDAMPDGGTLRLECRNTWLDAGYHATHPWVNPGPYICVSVADTGTGMDEVTKQRIFEPFFTTKPAGSGTGLGMAMVYSLMRQHDGMAQVYSELGRGTIVKLYFPAIVDSVQHVDRNQHTDPREIRGGNELILLVEDEPAIRRASRRALQGKGYSTIEAADGEEALEIFRQHSDSISLIISDLVMPKLGGRQLAAALREAGSTVPILFTSGYSPGSGLEEQALPPGVAFLMKPWSLSDLFGRVREMLDPRDVQIRENGV